MSNEELLNKRWEKTDRTLKEYLYKFEELSFEIIDDLLDIFDSLDVKYEDLNKTISKRELRKLDKKINDWKEQGIYDGYFEYLINSKEKYTYRDLIEILIYSVYALKEKKIKKYAKNIFLEVANSTYNQGYEEMSNQYKIRRKTPLEWEYVYSLLTIPTLNIHFYKYLNALSMQSTDEVMKKAITCYQQDINITEEILKDILKKQKNRLLCINDGKYSGVIDDLSRIVGNNAYLKVSDDIEDIQVRFIAEMDYKTTKMCRGMDNMLFFVHKTNKFYRYSEIDHKDVYYEVKGLVQGVNLPPINNHFHWCRSTITYLT